MNIAFNIFPGLLQALPPVGQTPANRVVRFQRIIINSPVTDVAPDQLDTAVSALQTSHITIAENRFSLRILILPDDDNNQIRYVRDWLVNLPLNILIGRSGIGHNDVKQAMMGAKVIDRSAGTQEILRSLRSHGSSSRLPVAFRFNDMNGNILVGFIEIKRIARTTQLHLTLSLNGTPAASQTSLPQLLAQTLLGVNTAPQATQRLLGLAVSTPSDDPDDPVDDDEESDDEFDGVDVEIQRGPVTRFVGDESPPRELSDILNGVGMADHSRTRVTDVERSAADDEEEAADQAGNDGVSRLQDKADDEVARPRPRGTQPKRVTRKSASSPYPSAETSGADKRDWLRQNYRIERREIFNVGLDDLRALAIRHGLDLLFLYNAAHDTHFTSKSGYPEIAVAAAGAPETTRFLFEACYPRRTYETGILDLARPHLSRNIYYQQLAELSAVTGIPVTAMVTHYMGDSPESQAIQQGLALGYEDKPHQNTLKSLAGSDDEKRRVLIAFFHGSNPFYRLTGGLLVEQAAEHMQQVIPTQYPLLPIPSVHKLDMIKTKLNLGEDSGAARAELKQFGPEDLAAMIMVFGHNLTDEEILEVWLRAFPDHAAFITELTDSQHRWILPTGTSLANDVWQHSLPQAMVSSLTDDNMTTDVLMERMSITKNLYYNYIGVAAYGTIDKARDLMRVLWSEPYDQTKALLARFPWLLLILPHAVDTAGNPLHLFGTPSKTPVTNRESINRAVYNHWAAQGIQTGRRLIAEAVEAVKAERGESQKSNQDFAIENLGFDSDLARRMFSWSLIPNKDELVMVAERLTNIDRRRLIEGFHLGELQYFMGMTSEGGVDWSLPAERSLPDIFNLDIENAMEQIAAINSQGAQTTYTYWRQVKGFSTRSGDQLSTTIRSGFSYQQIMIFSRLAAEAGLTHLTPKVIYLYFHGDNLRRFYPLGTAEQMAQAREHIEAQRFEEAQKSVGEAIYAYVLAGQTDSATQRTLEQLTKAAWSNRSGAKPSYEQLRRLAGGDPRKLKIFFEFFYPNTDYESGILNLARPHLTQILYYTQLRELSTLTGIDLRNIVRHYFQDNPSLATLVSTLDQGFNETQNISSLIRVADGNAQTYYQLRAFYYGQNIFNRLVLGLPIAEVAQIIQQEVNRDSRFAAFPNQSEDTLAMISRLLGPENSADPTDRKVARETVAALIYCFGQNLSENEIIELWFKLFPQDVQWAPQDLLTGSRWVLPTGSGLSDVWRHAIPYQLTRDLANESHGRIHQLESKYNLTQRQIANYRASSDYGQDKKAEEVIQHMDLNDTERRLAYLARYPWILMALPHAIDGEGRPLPLFGRLPSDPQEARRFIFTKVYQRLAQGQSGRMVIRARVNELLRESGRLTDDSQEYLTDDLRIPDPLARRMMSLADVLNEEELVLVAQALPGVDRKKLIEGYQFGTLQYFMGIDEEGGVDWSLPGMSLQQILDLNILNLMSDIARTQNGSLKTPQNFWQARGLISHRTETRMRQAVEQGFNEYQIKLFSDVAIEAGFTWLTPKVVYLHFHGKNLRHFHDFDGGGPVASIYREPMYFDGRGSPIAVSGSPIVGDVVAGLASAQNHGGAASAPSAQRPTHDATNDELQRWRQRLLQIRAQLSQLSGLSTGSTEYKRLFAELERLMTDNDYLSLHLANLQAAGRDPKRLLEEVAKLAQVTLPPVDETMTAEGNATPDSWNRFSAGHSPAGSGTFRPAAPTPVPGK